MTYRTFEPDAVDTMIARLRAGEPLCIIERDPDMPSADTIIRWEKGEDKELAERITRAREVGFDNRAIDAVDRAKRATDAALGRLAFDADRWLLSKIAPKGYGDKVAVTDGDGGPLQIILNKPA